MFRSILVFVLMAMGSVAYADFKSHRRYAVVPNTAQNRSLIQKCINKKICIHNSLQTIRQSCDGTAGIVKFNRTKLLELKGKMEPDDLKSLGITWLTHDQVISLTTNNPDWEC